MAEFQYFPENIQKTVLEHISHNERIEMCFIAGSSLSSDRDYVIITPIRIIIIDERPMGYLGRSYVNIKSEVTIKDIGSITVYKTFVGRLFGLSSMQLEAEGYKYIIRNGNSVDIDHAVKLIQKLKENVTLQK